MRLKIIQLSRLLLGKDASAGLFSEVDVAAVLSPAAVLALEGDADALRLFSTTLERLATKRWGLEHFGTRSGLNDAFALRSVVEAYEGLLIAGLIGPDHLDIVAPWLYAHARMRGDGSIANLPGFQPWHQRNQNVPASLVYLVAGLLERHTAPGRFATSPLRAWADSQMVGWDLTWRTPDDSWLYQYIWILSAYYHAKESRPELLHSGNARRSFDFYKTLSLPGGRPFIFGDSSPQEGLGPCVACALGASIFRDGELLSIAADLLNRVIDEGMHPYLLHRAPEMYRLYAHWPRDLEARQQERRESILMTSPLPGRGWSTGGTPYNEIIKSGDSAFPNAGLNFSSCDEIYQLRDPAKYHDERPDKLLLSRSHDPEGMIALVDFRAQGIHDHPDALGVTTLLDQGIAWLVETVYEPRGYNRLRWLHNTPLSVPHFGDASALKDHKADTWKEPELSDIAQFRFGDVDVVASRIRRDSFDYVAFDEGRFETERYFVFLPDHVFAVIDRITIAPSGGATVGQAWHLPADLVSTGLRSWQLEKGGKQLSLAFASSSPAQVDLSRRCPPEVPSDPFYFNHPVSDLLHWASFPEVTAPRQVSFAACFSRSPGSLSVNVEDGLLRVDSPFFKLQIGRFAELSFEVKP